MIDEKKVRLMTKLAIYEKHEANKSLTISKYYKSDYVRYNVLKTWVAATVVYWTIIAAYVFLKFDDLLAKINEIDYFDLMYKMLGGYVIVCLAYYLFSSMVYNYRYSKAKPGLVKYNANLKKLIALEGGGPVKRKVVERPGVVVVEDDFEGFEVGAEKQRPGRNVVRRSDMVKQRLEQKERLKEKEIIKNVQARNERLAAQRDMKNQREKDNNTGRSDM